MFCRYTVAPLIRLPPVLVPGLLNEQVTKAVASPSFCTARGRLRMLVSNAGSAPWQIAVAWATTRMAPAGRGASTAAATHVAASNNDTAGMVGVGMVAPLGWAEGRRATARPPRP